MKTQKQIKLKMLKSHHKICYCSECPQKSIGQVCHYLAMYGYNHYDEVIVFENKIQYYDDVFNFKFNEKFQIPIFEFTEKFDYLKDFQNIWLEYLRRK